VGKYLPFVVVFTCNVLQFGLEDVQKSHPPLELIANIVRARDELCHQ